MQQLGDEKRRLCLKSGQCCAGPAGAGRMFQRDDEGAGGLGQRRHSTPRLYNRVEQAKTSAIEMCPAQAISLVDENGG